MTASLTLATIAVDTTGKTITATISGGTGTGYAISSAAGLNPHLSTGNAYGFPLASASVSGTTLTVTLYTPIGSGETVQFDVTAASTLTDSGANTVTGQTNTAVTNNSTVTVTTVLVSTSSTSFELLGNDAGTTWRGSLRQWANAADWPVEFVAHATEVAILSNNGTTTNYRADGATATTTAPIQSLQNWNAKPATTSPLTADKHLFLVNTDNFIGVRLSGGNRTMHAVPTAKATIIAQSASLVGLPASSPVTLYGAWKVNTANFGDVAVSTYVGTSFEVGFTGSGLEIATLTHVNSSWAVSVDGGNYGALVSGGDATVSNQNQLCQLAGGLTAGAHTIKAMQVATGANTTHRGVRVINGTALTSAASIGDTTLTIGSAATLAVGDWIKIDTYGSREWRQVTGISGTTVTLGTALAKAHSIGAAVTSFSAPAGSLSAWKSKDLSAKRIVGMGDSNIAGANDYYPGADGAGNVYVQYDPRSPGHYALAQSLGYETVNLGIQGNTAANMATRAADMSTYAANGAGADLIFIWAGTNDINTTTTQASYSTSMQTIITAALAALKANGRVILMAPATPTTTNASGLNTAACAATLISLAASNGSKVVYAYDLNDALVAGDLSGVHYHVSGQAKIGQALEPYVAPAVTTSAMCAA